MSNRPTPHETDNPPAVAGALQRAERDLLDPDNAERIAAIFRALSDPTRLRIVSALSHAELPVGELAALLDMTQSAVSHQLSTLRGLRVVRFRRVGKQVYYTLDDAHVHDLYRRALEHAGHA